MVRSKTIIVAAAVCATVVGAAPAAAQDGGHWKIATEAGAASATLYSINTLTTGTRTIDYHPSLTVSCEAKRYPVWRQAVLTKRAISGGERAKVRVEYDNGQPFAEEWRLSAKNRALQLDGAEAVARLARARRFQLSWRFGVFSGSGEAVFDVSGLKERLVEMAAACDTPPP